MKVANQGDEVSTGSGPLPTVMRSVPRANRGPRAGSPRGVVVATGCNVHMIEDRDQETRSLTLPVLTPIAHPLPHAVLT
jgi:hypothetical protein